MERKKKIIFTLSTIFLGGIAGLLIIEIAVRVFHLGGDYFFRHNEHIGYIHIPDRAGWAFNPGEGQKVKIQINSLGLRDREYALAKPVSAKRILVLGDSYAEAFQVKLEDSFQEILESMLNEPEGRYHYEVINGGVSGFGTDNELLFYRHLGREFSPDLVMLTFVLNDVRENSYAFEKRYKGRVAEPYFVLENGELQLRNYPATRRFAALRNYSAENIHSFLYLWRFFQFRRLKEKAVNEENGMPLQFEIYLPDYDREWEEAWQLTKALILQIKNEAEADGAEFMLAIITQSVQVYPQHRKIFFRDFPAMQSQKWDWHKPNRIISEFCSEQRILYLDLLPLFEQHAAAHEQYLHYSGGHWNEAGHQLAARRLYEFIESCQLLK